MTLVPIIYTSLIIFSSFLLFVIIISYISFKMKGGHNAIRNHVQYIPKPIINSAPIRVVPNVPTIRKEYGVDYNLNLKRDKAENIFQSQITGLPKNIHVSEYIKAEQVQRNLTTNSYDYEKSQRRDNRSRIEIMNTSEKYRQQSYYQESAARNNRPIQNLTDVNLLNYYSDRNDTGFVSLKAI